MVWNSWFPLIQFCILQISHKTSYVHTPLHTFISYDFSMKLSFLLTISVKINAHANIKPLISHLVAPHLKNPQINITMSVINRIITDCFLNFFISIKLNGLLTFATGENNATETLDITVSTINSHWGMQILSRMQISVTTQQEII